LQELTQRITAGQVLPPTALASDLSPDLERIILTAMAANRDERFGQASELALELRALQLRAPSVSAIPAQEKSPAGGYPPADPPQTSPTRERSTPIPSGPDGPDFDQRGSQRSLSIYDTSPELPAQAQTLDQEEPLEADADQSDP